MIDLSIMNPPSCVAQRTRAQKFQEHFQKLKDYCASSTSDQGTTKGASKSHDSSNERGDGHTYLEIEQNNEIYRRNCKDSYW